MSLMLRKQERGRGKQVNATHVKDPRKDTANQRLPKEYGKAVMNSNSFFYNANRCLFAFHC